MAHSVENTIEAAHRLGDLFVQRRPLMDDWAKFCALPPRAGNVSTLLRGAARA